jgi:hypothetical protein
MKIPAYWARYRAAAAEFVDRWAAGQGLELLAFGVGVDAYFPDENQAKAAGCPRLDVLLRAPGSPAPAAIRMSILPDLWEQAPACRRVIASQLQAALDCLRT